MNSEEIPIVEDPDVPPDKLYLMRPNTPSSLPFDWKLSLKPKWWQRRKWRKAYTAQLYAYTELTDTEKRVAVIKTPEQSQRRWIQRLLRREPQVAPGETQEPTED
jgi:hypothetical protein